MRLAIIGAGMAGLAAGRSLAQRFPGMQITIYEKSRGFGGRMATRRREGYAFDHGAQVIKGPSPAVVQLLTEELPTTDLRQLDLPTWTFDGQGTIHEGDTAMNAETAYFYAAGNNTLGKLLAAGLDVRREVRIAALQRDGDGWQLIDTQEQMAGTADMVLFTAPAEQSADIISASGIEAGSRAELVAELGKGRYRRCLSLALAYDRLVARPFYALVNTDRAHNLAWLGLEHSKGETRCPPGHSLLIAQLADPWSTEHYADTADQLTPVVAEMVGALLGEDLDTPLWADLQRWRYALPERAADFERLNQLGSGHGLFFAGDYTYDKGRVHLAIERGWQAADLIAAQAG